MPFRSEHSLPRPHLSGKPAQIVILVLLWISLYASALFAPPVLDDADATHAQAAQAMLRTGDWVTLHVDGIRYLEKPPLPYWLTAISLRVFGLNTFAVHLSLALTVLGLALFGRHWADRAFPEDRRTGFYTGIFLLTSAGVFLFTRIFIPDALLSLLLSLVLYASLRALEESKRSRSMPWAFAAWTALALAVLTKGLVALVFVFGTLIVYLAFTGEWLRCTVCHRRALAHPRGSPQYRWCQRARLFLVLLH